MSQSVVKQLPLLTLLAKIKSVSKRKRLINDCCNTDFVKAIVECCWNLLNGRVQLTSHQKKRLCKHKTLLRNIADKKLPLKRKKVLMQSGGFIRLLPFLLGPIISTVTSLFKKK